MINEAKFLAKVNLFKRKRFDLIPIAESLIPEDAINNPFRFSKKQIAALEKLTDDKTNFVGYGGSAFSGKSYLLCYWVLLMCFSFPDTAYGLGRKELSNLKKTTLLTLFKIFAENGFEPFVDYNYNQQLNIITFNNGSQIFLIDTAYKPSDELYTRFGGYELTGAVVDESAETPIKAIEILFTRTGRRNNDKYKVKRKLLETFNPAKNHVYQRYYKPFRENSLKPTYCFIPALPADNPSPEAAEYIKGIIDNSDKTTVERLIYGNFEYDDDPAKLINFDCIINLFTNSFIKPTNKKYITADIAFLGSDRFVVGVWYGLVLKEIVVMDKSRPREVEETIRHLAKIHSVPRSHILFDGNGLGSYLTDYLQNAIAFINNGKPLIVPEEKEQYDNLKTQCTYKLAQLINDNLIFIEAKIDSKNKELLVEELEQIKRDAIDSDGKLKILSKEKIKEIIHRSPDFADMLMMRMYFEIKKRFSEFL